MLQRNVDARQHKLLDIMPESRHSFLSWAVMSRGEAQLYTSYTPPPKASFKAPAASAAEHAAALTLDESIGR
jgi:hypothetical protein